MIVKRVGPVSVGKVLGTMYAIVGLIIGGVLTLLASLGAAVGGQDAGPASLVIGVGAAIILPVFYGVAGLVGGIIMGWLYNVCVLLVGGIEVEFEQPPSYE